MKTIRNVVLVGLGAIGSIYAVKIHQHDPASLRVLVDEERLDRYRKIPRLFNGEYYDFSYALPEPGSEKADLILIATKSTGLDAAIQSIEPFVGIDTIILSLLNGVTSEEKIANKYGWDKVLYALYKGHISTREGNEITHDDVCTIVFGEAANVELSENVKAVQDYFDKVGIVYEVPEDMLFALWSKWTMIVGFNQASAVLGAPFWVFHNDDKAMQLAYDLMEEVEEIAPHAGVKNAGKLIEKGMLIVNQMPPYAKSSTLQDVEAGRQTEVDIFAGDVSRLGKKYGVPTPVNDVFLKIIKALDQKNAMIAAKTD